MSSEKSIEFTRENIDIYLKEVAKGYKKVLHGKLGEAKDLTNKKK